MHQESLNAVQTLVLNNIPFPAGAEYEETLSQFIPAIAPAGQYRMYVYVGNHPWNAEYYDFFTFTKAGVVPETVDQSVFLRAELWTAVREVSLSE